MFRLIASYPKSGNTYVRIFLAHYLRGETDLNKIGWPLFNSRAFFPLGMPVNRKLGIPSFPAETYSKTHEVAYGFHGSFVNRAIYIVRNPLDVVPSFARHMDISNDAAINSVGRPTLQLKGTERIFPQYISSWSKNVESWLVQRDFPVFFVRYETLAAFPEHGFRKMLEFLECIIDEAKFKASLEFSKFSALKEKEEKMLAASEAEKNDKLKFREARGSTGKFFNVGQAGNGVQVLTPTQVNLIYKRHKKFMDLFHYAPLKF